MDLAPDELTPHTIGRGKRDTLDLCQNSPPRWVDQHKIGPGVERGRFCYEPDRGCGVSQLFNPPSSPTCPHLVQVTPFGVRSIPNTEQAPLGHATRSRLLVRPHRQQDETHADTRDLGRRGHAGTGRRRSGRFELGGTRTARSGVVATSTNGVSCTAVAEHAGSGWTGRALGIQTTGQNTLAAATPPALALAIGAAGFAPSFAVVAMFPLLTAILCRSRPTGPQPTTSLASRIR